MTFRLRFWPIILMMCFSHATAQTIAVYTHNAAEATVVHDGSLAGKPHAGKRAYFVELVRALLEELDLPDAMENVPLARGMGYLKTGPRTVFFNLDRIPEREAMAYWVGPIWSETNELYENVREPTDVHTLDAARALPICVLNGNVHDQQLTSLGFEHIVRSQTYAQCFRMLLAGRVALTASSGNDLPHILRDADIDLRAIRSTSILLSITKGYIALSKGFSQKEVDRWQAALEKLQKSGRLTQLYDQYGR